MLIFVIRLRYVTNTHPGIWSKELPDGTQIGLMGSLHRREIDIMASVATATLRFRLNLNLIQNFVGKYKKILKPLKNIKAR